MEENQEYLKLGHESEPFNLRHHQSRSEIKVEKPKRKFSLSFPVIIVSLFILIVTALAIGTVFYVKHTQTKIAAINNFEDCVAAGNPVMESYPEQCSANGQTFTRTLTEEEQKKLSSDPMANWSIADSTDNVGWKIYTNTKYGYSFEMPSTWKIGINQGTLEMFILESPNYSDDGSGSVLEITTGTDLERMTVEQQLAHYDPATVKVEDIKVDNISAVKLGYDFDKESSFAQYHTQFINDGVSYDLDFYSWDEKSFNSDIQIYDQLLSTFKFTDQNTAIDTSDWKTFETSDYSISAPSDFRKDTNVSRSDGFLTITNYDVASAPGRGFSPDQDKGLLKVEIYSKDTSNSLDEHVDGTYEKTNINGLPVYEVIGSEGPGTGYPSYYVRNPTKNRIYSIHFWLDFNNYPELRNQILSTFKFTE